MPPRAESRPGERLAHLKVTETTPGEYALAGALDTTAVAEVLAWFAAEDAQVTAVNAPVRSINMLAATAASTGIAKRFMGASS